MKEAKTKSVTPLCAWTLREYHDTHTVSAIFLFRMWLNNLAMSYSVDSLCAKKDSHSRLYDSVSRRHSFAKRTSALEESSVCRVGGGA